MIIQGSMKYSPSGRRRKTNAWKKAKQPNFVAQSKKNFKQGAVAQLGERLPCTEEVAGSTPVSSTNSCKTKYKNDELSKEERLEISKQYTVAPAYNKGAYQVIPKGDIEWIGK